MPSLKPAEDLWKRVPQHRYAIDVPVPLFKVLKEKSKDTGLTVRDIVLRSVEAALAMEAEG